MQSVHSSLPTEDAATLELISFNPFFSLKIKFLGLEAATQGLIDNAWVETETGPRKKKERGSSHALPFLRARLRYA